MIGKLCLKYMYQMFAIGFISWLCQSFCALLVHHLQFGLIYASCYQMIRQLFDFLFSDVEDCRKQ